MKKKFMLFTAAVCLLVGSHAYAGVKYEDGDKYIKLGGRIQVQYHLEDPDRGDSEDELFFRRLRPYIEGSVHKDWKGKFQWDMGKGKVAVKDAYFQYSGLDMLDIIVGNHNFPFSRELLTSSKKQQLVERTFVGDHNYGTPDRQTGLHLKGDFMEKKIGWGASIAKGAIDPSNSKLDFDTVIQIDAGDDWNEGDMVGARVDYFPLGNFKFSQGDFKKETKLGFGIGAYTWSNDEDANKDVDTVTGLEVSGAFRGFGLSVDLQYNMFDSELYDATVTDGIYENGETTLQNYAIEAGYMVLPARLELVAGYESQDADGYDETWNRMSGGLNYYIKKHDIKVQTTYRMGENKDGEKDNDVDELFVQLQYVF